MKPEVRWTLLFLRREVRNMRVRVIRNTDAFGLPLNEDAAVTNVPFRVLTMGILFFLLALAAIFVPAAAAEEKVRLECAPRTFRVVPGEPMRLELTVRADSAAAIRLHVPGDPLLKLRALEKLPVRRSPEGVIVHRRVVVWQALEPGSVKIDQLSVETKNQKRLFPVVTITVCDPGP